MYQILKNCLRKIIPRKILNQNEFFLRKVYALFYSGNSFQCNICDKKLRKFITNERNELLCPKCGSLDRDRRLWQLLESRFLMNNPKILDFSPSRSLYNKHKSIPKTDYSSTDLSGHFLSDFQYDITQMGDVKPNTYDLITCYHILEHIEKDTLAMSELSRVLKPDGHIIIQTPFKDGEIYENPLIISPEERLKHFGQEDHVRIYSKEGLKNRLESIGLKVEVKHYENSNNYNGFVENETILIATKN
jgi:SAM-dependent methyltransferase